MKAKTSKEKVYPTKNQLDKIVKWDFEEKTVIELLDYVRTLWRFADSGFHLTGKQLLKLKLHTGNLPENENIIKALKNNKIFWELFWEKSVGNNHYFRFKG